MTIEETHSMREEFASEFDRLLDPLAKFEPAFERVSSDPFELFMEQELLADDPKYGTIKGYQTTFEQWKEYMAKEGRHPACPTEAHVVGFAHWLQNEKNNRAIATIRQKLHKLNRAYRFWQWESSLPHNHEYDPIKSARNKIRWSEFEDVDGKSPHPFSVSQLRGILSQVENVRDHAYIFTQLKLGLRVGELCNIRLKDVNLDIEDLCEYYPELGTHRMVEDRPSAIYIPSKHERDGNKSQIGRVLPLDHEMQEVLGRYLLIRPTVRRDWLYLSKQYTQSTTKEVNRAWKRAFHPKYDETEEYRPVTSHLGRHWFTTYRKKDQELPQELVQYMRGDVVGGPVEDRTAMHHYLHAYYDDIEHQYRRDVYNLL